MSRAERIEEAEEARDLTDYAPRTPEGRLREWSRARWYAPVNVWPPESAMYAVLHNPGRATGGQSDGGLGALADADGIQLARQARVRDVSKAIAGLPTELQAVIRYMYDVPQRERPKGEKTCADHFEVTRAEMARTLAAAYGWIARDLALPNILGRDDRPDTRG